MRTYVFTTNSGLPVYTSTPSSDNDYVEGNEYAGYLCHAMPDEINEVDLITNYWFNGSAWMLKPPRPSNFHQWRLDTASWEDPRTLQDLKDAQWTLIKQARSAAEYAGFAWDGSTFDSDAISQNRITGAVTLAMLSPAFTIDWVLADNTTRLLDQAGMAQVGGALGAHVAAQFAKGVMLRAQIEAATSQAEVESVLW
jgi:hypothetical protein